MFTPIANCCHCITIRARPSRAKGGTTGAQSIRLVPKQYQIIGLFLVRALPSHGRGHWFESSIAHHPLRWFPSQDSQCFHGFLVFRPNRPGASRVTQKPGGLGWTGRQADVPAQKTPLFSGYEKSGISVESFLGNHFGLQPRQRIGLSVRIHPSKNNLIRSRGNLAVKA